jgi:hypothetical protein
VGAWGTAIFSDDTACDVRDEWREAILAGLTPEDATARLVESFGELRDGAENEKLFWMALAAAQMETGRLLSEVRGRALAIIEAGGDVARWEEDGDAVSARQRARVLGRLAEKLRGPQPKPKRLRRPVALSLPFEIGDFVRVRDPDKPDDEALVVVVGQRRQESPPHDVDPIIVAFDWDGGPVPDPGDLVRLPFVADPITGDRPLIVEVFTVTRKDVFGPHVGDVIAHGVGVEVEFDPEFVNRHMGWSVVASAVQEAQLMARWYATPEGWDALERSRRKSNAESV